MDFLESLFPFIKKQREKEKKRRAAIAVTFILVGLALGLTGAAVIVYNMRNRIPDGIAQSWGVTFSKKYAEELGMDWKESYLATLDDLGARKLRIPAYWDEIEPVQGVFDFTSLDWMLSEAQRRGAKVMLTVGRRLPRWPECHDPPWLRRADLRGSSRLPGTQIYADSENGVKEALLKYIRVVVERYRAHPAVERWQVENEPFLDIFGVCPPPNPNVLGKEIELVRSLDVRQIVVTDSGELSSWIALSNYGDILGVSLYRVVWNQWFGYFYWPLPASYYRKKAELTLYRARPHTNTGVSGVGVKDVIITEVQLEPWTDRPIFEIPLTEQLKHFDEKHFRDTIGYARRTGLSEIYLWGVEWWWWAKRQGHPEFWNMAKEVFRNENVSLGNP